MFRKIIRYIVTLNNVKRRCEIKTTKPIQTLLVSTDTLEKDLLLEFTPRYLVNQRSGEWYIFENKPFLIDNEWVSLYEGGWESLETFGFTPEFNWDKTIIEINY